MKNAFYFTLKAVFVLKMFVKIYDATTWLTNNSIHILPNISRSKGNQTLKFGQLIEYNMRNIFAEKSYTKYSYMLFPDPYLKNQN